MVSWLHLDSLAEDSGHDTLAATLTQRTGAGVSVHPIPRHGRILGLACSLNRCNEWKVPALLLTCTPAVTGLAVGSEWEHESQKNLASQVVVRVASCSLGVVFGPCHRSQTCAGAEEAVWTYLQA